MERAIRSVTVPGLRDIGFKGSFPHFRRPIATQIELLTFQFYSSGGSFVVELAACHVDGFTHSWGKHVPSNKVTAHDIGRRHRLGSANGGDYWFVFGKPSYEMGSDKVERPEHYKAVAASVLFHFQKEADAFWRTTV
jgi:hypothetical protein